jgi:glyoxylase-like metal-dependent hydrolase (beta-lactamase superfamily II)
MDGYNQKHGTAITPPRCLATPCHTQDSICYYVTDTSDVSSLSSSSPSSAPGAVFTGDTLFIAGCGRFFEGTGKQMHAAFELQLGTLPDATVTYVGHEYTASNLKFALSVDPGNAALARLAELVRTHAVTVGRTTIADEKEWNVFWRLSSDPVRWVPLKCLFCCLLCEFLNRSLYVSRCWLHPHRRTQGCYQGRTRRVTG